MDFLRKRSLTITGDGYTGNVDVSALNTVAVALKANTGDTSTKLQVQGSLDGGSSYDIISSLDVSSYVDGYSTPKLFPVSRYALVRCYAYDSDGAPSTAYVTGYQVTVDEAGDVEVTPGFTGADGYVAFFTGPYQIAGDNDLFWDRETNQLLLRDGTTSVPSIAFKNDSDTGIFRASDNIIDIACDGSTVLKIGSTTVQLYGNLNARNKVINSSTGAVLLGKYASTGHGLGVDDVIVGGDLEVDGTAYLDSELQVASTAYFSGALYFGSSNRGGLVCQADSGLLVLAGDNNGQGNHNIILTSSSNSNTDHDHDTYSTNPTLFIHSATDPDTDNAQWLSLSHNQTDGYVSLGTGALVVDGAVGSAEASVLHPDGATCEVDFELGNTTTIDLEDVTGDITVSLTGGRNGFSYVVCVIQDTSTARQITSWGADVEFPDSILPVVSTGSRAVDLFCFTYMSDTFYCTAAQNMGTP